MFWRPAVVVLRGEPVMLSLIGVWVLVVKESRPQGEHGSDTPVGGRVTQLGRSAKP